jgi:biotin operon repressor
LLFRRTTLKEIATGKITIAFRRWKRPTVKPGGTLKTPVGVLTINSVNEISIDEISASDIKHSGHESLHQLLDELNQREGVIYRISFKLSGKDPRIALRKNDQLTEAEFQQISNRLRSFDSSSKMGVWTQKVLQAIGDYPEVPALQLAAQMGYERAWLKIHIRKLKNMGLTISYNPGYRLSPRGKAVLRYLSK